MPKSILLSNDGTQPLELDIAVPPTEDFTFDTSSTKLMLMPNDTTKIAVVFAPKSPGQKGESIEVRLKGTQINIASITIEGEATKPVAPVPMDEGCSATQSGRSTGAGFVIAAMAAFALVLRRRRFAL